jgi:hypothetical protein
MDDELALEGPVEKKDGKLVLLIPLEAGGDQFVESTRGISEIEGEYLKIVIEDWLADLLRVREGSIVAVRHKDGKFNIRAVDPMPLQ